MSKPVDFQPADDLHSVEVIRNVLRGTDDDLRVKQAARDVENARRLSRGKQPKPLNRTLTFAISFSKHVGAEIARELTVVDTIFRDTRSGETPSEAVRGPKRLDLSYSTRERGLGLAMSFKSVHRGEKQNGDIDFIHNLKRNDEELRVESTDHHLRQPYAVLVAVVFLPFEACEDLQPTSSFGAWVQYLWPLKGRDEPEDPPDLFELVFVALYARDASELGFYEVGGTVECPRHGRPRRLLTVREFLLRVRTVYNKRNGRDFYFEGEGPAES
jgi:hypothetical protein